MLEFDTPRRPPPTINLSALIDIAFILVIFIVLAATFQRIESLDVDLPSADAPSSADDEALVVTVPKAGPLRFGETEVPEAQVVPALKNARASHRAILLLADREAAVQRAVSVLAEAQKLGFESVSIATERPRGGKGEP